MKRKELSKISKIIPSESLGNITVSSIENIIKYRLRQYFIDGGGEEERFLLLKSFYGLAKNDVDFLSENFFIFSQKTLSENAEFFIQANLPRRQTAEKIIEKIKELAFSDFKKDIEEVTAENDFPSILEKLKETAEKYGVLLSSEIIQFFSVFSLFDTIALRISPDFDMIKTLNSFFEEYPLERIESMAKKRVLGKEIDADWELFKEVFALEKEKRMIMKERATEMVFNYAEKYEEIRSLLKTIK